MKKITKDTVLLICKALDFPLQQARAIIKVESSGKGCDEKTGRIKIQFEPHIFHQQLEYRKIEHDFSTTRDVVDGKTVKRYRIVAEVGGEEVVIVNGVQGQEAEWKAYIAACKIHDLSAKISTSWGLGQIMGFNAIAAGYSSVQEMVSKFSEDEGEQLRGMLQYIKRIKTLYGAVQSRNAAKFAEIYNGKGYKEYDYDTKLTEAGF